MTRPTIPLAAARALAIHTQGLDTPNGEEPAPTLDVIDAMVHRVGCVQIDTLHVVARAHYLTLWSRLGTYDMADFDRLIYDPEHRTLFEYWAHAASIMPLRDYRHRMSLEHHANNPARWWDDWATRDENSVLTKLVMDRIRADGPQRAADFEYEGPKRGPWWDWKPVKVALEGLFMAGDLMVTRREKFQRFYDIRERVLPSWVDTSPATPDEAVARVIELSALAQGITDETGLVRYTYYRTKPVLQIIKTMVADGTLVKVQAETSDGGTSPMLVHRDNLPLLDRALDGEITPRRTTFLNFFDSLLWGHDRVRRLWGFENMIEAYKREENRIYGYFCLSILHHDKLIGRFDPVVDRKKGILRLKALYLEPGIQPDDALIAAVATALRDFMTFHNARDLTIDKSQPAAFAKKLLKAL